MKRSERLSYDRNWMSGSGDLFALEGGTPPKRKPKPRPPVEVLPWEPLTREEYLGATEWRKVHGDCLS